MDPYLSVRVGKTETHIEYVVDRQAIVAHTHPIGTQHIEREGMNAAARSKFIDGIMYTLEFVSLYDRIPTHYKVSTVQHATWLRDAIEGASYTQFYTGDSPVRVTIEGTQDPSAAYARHTQTIFPFFKV